MTIAFSFTITIPKLVVRLALLAPIVLVLSLGLRSDSVRRAEGLGAPNSVAAGGLHTCTRTSGGQAWCWGYNFDGQLGDGTITNRLAPVNVPSLVKNVTAIAAGGVHTCALVTGGGVKCWGYNLDGELGDGTTTNRSNPVDVCASGSGADCPGGSALTGVVALAAGGNHSCALTTTGGVKCWGFNGQGQLGDGTTLTPRLNPVDVCASGSGAGCVGGSALAGVVAIAAGGGHTCALTGGGGVKCWGLNSNGQLGNGTASGPQTNPVDVCASGSGAGCGGGSALTGATAITVGAAHSCAITAFGRVKCWGYNIDGELGDGTNTSPRTNPVDVCVSGSGAGCAGGSAVAGVTAVAAGAGHTCAITAFGGVKCWGYNVDGELGDGTNTSPRTNPVDVCAGGSGAGCSGGSALTGVIAISAGGSHTCVLAAGVRCWGLNGNGQLGDGTTTTPRTNPVNALPRPVLWYPWDINGDGVVNVPTDILGVAQHFGSDKP